MAGAPESAPHGSAKAALHAIQRASFRCPLAAAHAGTVQITEQDLAPYAYGYSSNGLAKAAAGERYIIHGLGVGPEAVLTQPYGKLPAGTVIRLQSGSNQPFRIILLNKPMQPTPR